MKARLYSIKCLTNLHVGNGDVNFNIIDNEVERDIVTNFPTIHSSGVKGALRQFFKENEFEKLNEIFGSPKDDDEKMAGRLKFIAASMLAIPMRASLGDRSYYLVTTKKSLELFKQSVDAFGISLPTMYNETDLSQINENQTYKLQSEPIEIEGYTIHNQIKNENICNFLKGNLEENVVILPSGTFCKINLPVIARNHLEDGRSKNLWYEEIVPHQSVFYFFVLAGDDDPCFNGFNLNINEKVIQFGGNASIGYGQCLVKEIGSKNASR